MLGAHLCSLLVHVILGLASTAATTTISILGGFLVVDIAAAATTAYHFLRLDICRLSKRAHIHARNTWTEVDGLVCFFAEGVDRRAGC